MLKMILCGYWMPERARCARVARTSEGIREADFLAGKTGRPGKDHFKHLLFFLLTFLFVASVQCEAWAGLGSDVRRANRLYEEEKYTEALENYDKALSEKPDDPVIQYNRAAALYRKGDFIKAAQAFLKSLAGGDESIEKRAIYNTGNSEYRGSEKKEQKGASAAIPGYKKALEYYKKAMQVDPKDMDAKYNYEFTLKKIKDLEKQQQQQDQQQQKQQQQDRKQQQQDQKEQKDQQDKQRQQDQKEQKDQQDKQRRQDQKEKKDQQDRERQQQQKDQEEEERQQQDQQQKDQQQQDRQDRFPKQQKPDTMEKFEGEMSREQAEMLLRSQDEEEARKRAEQKKAAGGQRPPVIKDW